jgi:hypothetical protein
MAAAAPILPGSPKVVTSDYEGFGPTLQKVAAYIRQAGDSPEFQRFAASIVDKVYPRSRHTTNREIAQVLLDHCNQHIRFRPDPPLTERVTKPALVLCLEGPGAFCLPVEDCESTAAAYLSLCRAMGIDVQLLKQTLHDPTQPEGEREVHHLAGLIRLDNGSWVKVDPSLKGNSKVGDAQPALKEEAIDILDPRWSGADGGAKFVAIGAKPSYLWAQEPKMYRPMFPALGHGSGKPCCAACAKSGGSCGGKKPKSVAETFFGRMIKEPTMRPMIDAFGRMVQSVHPVQAPQNQGGQSARATWRR